MPVKPEVTDLEREGVFDYRQVDFLLSERRNVATAKEFMRKAMKNNGTPRVITLDAYVASHRAITELKAAGTQCHIECESGPVST